MEDLARQIEVMQNGTHPEGTSSGNNTAPGQNPPDVSVPALLEIEDLKRKVVRLIEQATQHTQDISSLTPLIERVNLAENQTIRFRHRIPDLTDTEPGERMVTAVEVQEQLNGFKGATQQRIEDVRQVRGR